MRADERFVLYRILGNDLPPRHGTGQTAANLEFILEHEPALERCEKRWVVNRIADVRAETRIVGLLQDRRQHYLRIPFVESEYLTRRFDFDGMVPDLYFHRARFRARKPRERDKIMEWCYRHKNLYLMNLNAARNAALREGRLLADWVMPFDGACFFTASGWAAVLEAAAHAETAHYLLVPLARVVDSDRLLEPRFEPESLDEPQIAFRKGAGEAFDERLRYGTMSKTALLHRLGVPGPWRRTWLLPWEEIDLAESPEAGRYVQAGWVARLASGNPEADRDARTRNVQRWASAAHLCLAVEGEILRKRLPPDRLCFFDEATLEAERRAWRDGEPALAGLVGQLRLCAERVLDARSLSVMAGARPRLENVTVLALCWYFTQEQSFVRTAAGLLRTWFLGAESRIHPRVGTFDLAHALDAVRLVSRSGSFTLEENEALCTSFREFLDWLGSSEQGQRAYGSAGPAGICYELQVAALSLFLGELPSFCYHLDLSRMRIAGIRSEGSLHLQLLNMQLWANLARLARTAGTDLWSFETRDRHSLAKALMAVTASVNSIVASDPGLDPARIRLAVLHASSPKTAQRTDARHLDKYRLPPLVQRDSAVAPFWSLGLAPC
jgi:hypothetical protein